MNPGETLAYPSPFHHLRPELWQRTKVLHIILTIIGTIFMIPVLYLMLAAALFMTSYGGGFSLIPDEYIPGAIAILVSICSGGFAWSALGLLFFKRTDARWQRICWSIVAVFGWITVPCSTGWWLHLAQEVPSIHEDSDVLWFHLFFLFIIGVALLCAVSGPLHARRAVAALRTPVREPQLPCP